MTNKIIIPLIIYPNLSFDTMYKIRKTVTIEKQVILKRANIHTFGNAFSGHIQSNELINDLKGVRSDILFIHHSDGENKYILADTIREEARKCNNTMKVIAVDNKNNQFEL